MHSLSKLFLTFVGFVGLSLASPGGGEDLPAVCDFAALRARWPKESCEALTSIQAGLPDLLRRVRPYTQTYVLVLLDRPDGVPWAWDDPVLSRLRVGLLADTPAETIAARYKFAQVVPYPLSPAGACALFADLHRGKIDAGLVWAPLAGYFVAVTDVENRLQALPVPQPLPPLEWPKSAWEGASASDSDLFRCADRIQGVLESYGVAPAELLTANVEESSVIPDQPPPEDLAAARVGEALYYRYCDRCHGTQAVLGRRGLELRQRFLQLSYPEFIRAIWEGRPGRGMPAYRGLLDKTQIEALYQYLRALTLGKIAPRQSTD